MTAERLRAAATVLRERATDDELTDERVMPTAVYINSAKYLVMSPPVALALADWLDWFVKHAASKGWNAIHADAVADAILGDRS